MRRMRKSTRKQDLAEMGGKGEEEEEGCGGSGHSLMPAFRSGRMRSMREASTVFSLWCIVAIQHIVMR